MTAATDASLARQIVTGQGIAVPASGRHLAAVLEKHAARAVPAGTPNR